MFQRFSTVVSLAAGTATLDQLEAALARRRGALSA